VDDGNVSDAKLVIEHEEDFPASLGASLSGSSTGLKGSGEEGLLRGGDPPQRTTSARLSWCITQSMLGVGHVRACSESVAARGMPQKQSDCGCSPG
jgi:hypothetical protein